MRLHFTKHATQKFSLQRKAGFPLPKTKVKTAILRPDRLERGREEVFIATKVLDEEFALRVVYRKTDDIIVIITFYPVKRSDYEI